VVSDEELKIKWPEFRSMMLLLPPATTIRNVLELVRATNESARNERALLKEWGLGD
jgi:hypothetical protein